MSQVQARREKLLEMLPQFGWSIIKAGIAAGYSRKYAEKTLTRQIQKNAGFCRRILEKKQAIEAGSVDRRDKTARVLEKIIDDDKAHDRDRIHAAEALSKMSGWNSETRIIETPARERILSEAYQQKARELAVALLDTRALPPGVAPIIDATAGPEVAKETAKPDGPERNCGWENDL